MGAGGAQGGEVAALVAHPLEQLHVPEVSDELVGARDIREPTAGRVALGHVVGEVRGAEQIRAELLLAVRAKPLDLRPESLVDRGRIVEQRAQAILRGGESAEDGVGDFDLGGRITALGPDDDREARIRSVP